MIEQNRRPILILDGLNNFIPSFCVNESMTVAGELVGGVLGFLRVLRNLVSQFKPSQVFVCWEQGGASPRRKHIYPEYKANRAKGSEFKELYKENGKLNPMADQENKAKQLMLLSTALGFLPVCQLYVQDVEADDIVAWLVKTKFKTYEGNKIVVSNDKDFYQLLEDDSVRIYNPATKSLVTREDVVSKFSIDPRNITLARAVVGDESDNIAGVPGIGLKTIAKRFGELLDGSKDYDVGWLVEKSKVSQIETKKPPRCFQDIVLNESIVRRNWQLMYLDNSSLAVSQIAKLDYRIDEFKPVINYMAYLKVFTGADIPVTRDIDAIPSEFRFLTITS